MKREYISLNFIYFSQNFRYISLNCKCNHLNYGHSGYLISDLLLNCRYFSSSFEYISLHALFYQCTSLRSEFDLVYFFSFTCKKYHSPHLQGGLGENWLRNYLEDPIVVELKPQLGCPNSTTYLFASDCIFSSNLHILRTVLNVKVNVSCRSTDIRRWVLLIDMLTPCNLT